MAEEIERLTQAIELNPQNWDAYFNRGLAYSRKEKWDEAIADYHEAIKLNPENSDAYFNRGCAYSRKEKWDEAIADFNQAINLNPKNSDAYYARGFAYGKKGELDEAIADYGKTINLNPENLDAYFHRGFAYLQKKEWDKAITDFNQAINLNSENLDAYFNRGIAYFQKEKWDKAIEDYDKAIELNPEDSSVYFNRGIAYHQKKECVKAIEDINQAIKLNTEDSDAYFYRGIIHSQKEERDEAIADFNQAINLKPENSHAYYARGIIYSQNYSQKGEWDEAIADFNEAIKLNPQHADAYYARGIAYSQKGEWDEAIADFNEAIEHNPQHADAYFHRWFAYTKKEEWDNAIKNFDGLDPILKSIDIKIYVASRVNDVIHLIPNNDRHEFIESYIKLTRLIEDIQSELFYDPQGPEVAHYTSLDKINELVGGAHFRLYNSSYMNDPEEGHILFDVLKDTMQDTKIDLETMFYGKDGDIPDLSPAYIGSFVKLDDSSAQEGKDKLFLWRTYGRHNGKDAAGGCLIFPRGKFAKKHLPQIGHMGQQASMNLTPSLPQVGDTGQQANMNLTTSLPQVGDTGQLNSKPPIYEIVYKGNDMTKSLQKLLSDLADHLQQTNLFIEIYIKENDTKDKLKQLACELLDGIRFLFKAKHYREEQEVRVILFRYRSGNKMQKSDEIKVDKASIPPRFYLETRPDFRCKEVILGPMVQNPQDWKWWLEEQDVKVKQSKIKYISHD